MSTANATTHHRPIAGPPSTFAATLDELRGESIDPEDLQTIGAAAVLSAHRRGWDVGEYVCVITAAAAATLHLETTASVDGLTGVDELLSNRSGSWEAAGLRDLLDSTVGHDAEHLESHRLLALDPWRPARRFHAHLASPGRPVDVATRTGSVSGDPIPDDVTHLAEAWTEDSSHAVFGVDYVWQRATTPNGDGWVRDGETDVDEDGNQVDHRPWSDEQVYADCDELVEIRTDAGVRVIA